MHIPRGKPVHERLKTSYVNTAALLADLQVSGFSGYLQAKFITGHAYILIDGGRILNAIDIGPERTRKGEEAIDAILLRASMPDGEISVFTHTPVVIEAISGRIDGDSLYQGLESEFTDLKKLVAKLCQQQDARYYIEVKLGQEGDGIIYMIDGEVNAVLSLPHGEIIDDDAAYERMVALTAEHNAVFDVFRCVQPQASMAAMAGANVIAFPEPPPSVPMHEVSEPLAMEQPDNETETEPEPSELTVALTESPELDQDEDDATLHDRLIAVLGEIVQVIERSTQRVAREANFAVALRAGLLSVTGQYPFFDPFAAEFEYQNGKIRFTAEASAQELVTGLSQALRHALRELVRMAPTTQLRQVVANALMRLEQLRKAEFERFNLAPAVTEIVAID